MRAVRRAWVGACALLATNVKTRTRKPCQTKTEIELSESQRDRQLPLGCRGPYSRYIQARKVPGRHSSAHRAAAARLRARAHENQGHGNASAVQGQDRRSWRAAAQGVGLRFLQHLALRLREAPR